ncbi:hypothetical protein CERSUDRAFT_118748 [Gelatoporia subvermispora B]|uniref:LysM domain-containing protein n=1 Tax=Ceriporiopsis subvermispora (strain B) TaxID=914234 RepID=M2PA83_CERS8|nr:hypothetical protein CERSUDRAFT_118748 [Gelatoporia subvermispora B]
MFARSAVVAFVALPLLAQTSFAQTCTRTYTVQDGDICDGISAAHNVSTYQLAVVNPSIDSECNNLQSGQSLCLGYEGEDCSTTHVVQLGDTCDDIAQTYGFNATILNNLNPQLDAQCDNLYVGEVVCVANNAAVPSPPAGSALPAATIPATAIPANPSATPAPTSAAAAAASSAASGDDDDDDSDLPYCDEL